MSEPWDDNCRECGKPIECWDGECTNMKHQELIEELKHIK